MVIKAGCVCGVCKITKGLVQLTYCVGRKRSLEGVVIHVVYVGKQNFVGKGCQSFMEGNEALGAIYRSCL